MLINKLCFSWSQINGVTTRPLICYLWKSWKPLALFHFKTHKNREKHVISFTEWKVSVTYRNMHRSNKQSTCSRVWLAPHTYKTKVPRNWQCNTCLWWWTFLLRSTCLFESTYLVPLYTTRLPGIPVPGNQRLNLLAHFLVSG